MPILKVFDLTDGARDYVVGKQPLVIGRDKSQVDICLHDMTASRVHAKIYVKDNEYYVEDLNSSCGVIVDGKLITIHKLVFNDHLQIGNTLMEFCPTDEIDDISSQNSDTVDELLLQYRTLPSKMQLSYRVLKVMARSLYKPGDTIVIGRGGLLVQMDLSPEDQNYALELKVTWPDGTVKVLLGEVVARIKQGSMLCIKLHHISEDKFKELFTKVERGSWNKVLLL